MKQTWLDWCEVLKIRKDEVMQTLKNEGVHSESCFYSRDDNAIYYYIEADDLEKARQVSRMSKLPIDELHKKFRDDSLQKVEILSELFYFPNHSHG
jgi:L-rhamnose mutarotase